jgi:hypothetical protein
MKRAAVALLALSIAACAPPAAPKLPTGAGAPFPDFASAYGKAIAGCGDIKTFTAVLAMSGRAGRTKLRGRLEAGFAAPASMRLEGIAPFGRPIFVLTAVDERGTLVLSRDDRVLRDAPAASIVEALAGVPMGASEMRSIVTGCGLPQSETPTAGRAYAGDWAVIDFPDYTAYLRRGDNAWHLSAATRGTLSVFYADFDQRRPATIRVRVERDGRVTADITLRVSQADVNSSLEASVFAADVPPDAEPLTLDELRRAGPLGDR